MTTVRLDGVSKTYVGAAPALSPTTITVESGEFFTLLGPSGCGKTTTLRIVAGFEQPTSGTVSFDGQDVTNLAPEKRDLGMVFQNYALFPHLNVAENVGYGLRNRKVTNGERADRVAAALESVGLAAFATRGVSELSGGQQQRVALARALVLSPQVLLLDEPLSNLDARLRDDTRTQVRTLQREAGITALYVTHDQAEALAVSDRIAVLNNGVVHQVGTPWEIYHHPATAFVASFIGRANLLPAVASGSAADIGGASLAFASASPHDGDVMLAIRPERVAVVAPGAGTIDAVVTEVEFLGSHSALTVLAALPSGDIEVRATVDEDGVNVVSHRIGDRVALDLSRAEAWEVAP